MSINNGNSNIVEKGPDKIYSRRSFLKGLLAASAGVATSNVLTGCNGGGGSSEVLLESIDIKNTSLEYSALENNSLTITFEQIITDAGITGIDSNVDNPFEVIYNVSSEITVDTDSKTIIFNSPLVDTKTGYDITFKVKDSYGNISDKSLTITFYSLDEEDDSPLVFNESDLTSTSSILLGEDFSFTANPTDIDGIDSVVYQIKYSDGSPYTSGVLSVGVEENIPSMPLGSYTLEVTATGIDGGEGNNSQAKTITRNFDVNEVDITPDQFNFTDLSDVTVDTLLDSDLIEITGINSEASIVITTDGIAQYQINGGSRTTDPGVVNNGDFVRTRIYSSSNEGESKNVTINVEGVQDTFTVTTLSSNTAPTASDASVDAGFNDIVTLDLSSYISDAETADSGLVINVVSGPSHGSIIWNSNTEFTYEVTNGTGYSGSDSFTYKVTDPGSLESDIKTVTILNIFDS